MNETVALDAILRALESEAAKLDSLQSLCGVVAEAPGTFSDHVVTGSMFAIMNNVEGIKDRLGDIVLQLMALQRKRGQL